MFADRYRNIFGLPFPAPPHLYMLELLFYYINEQSRCQETNSSSAAAYLISRRSLSMPNRQCQLYTFLKAAKGNWRNAIFVSCSSPACPYTKPSGREGFFLSADDLGQPLLVSVEVYRKCSGEPMCTDECCSAIPCQAFLSMYSEYLTWHLPASDSCPLDQLCVLPNSKRYNK